MVALYCVKRYSKKKKLDSEDFNALRSSLKVPASATPNEVDRESVQKRVWVSEWIVTSSQESRNSSSLGNCCFSRVRRFPRQKNQTNGSRQSNAVVKQAKEKYKALRYSWSDVIRHQSILTRSTSLGVAKAGGLELNVAIVTNNFE